MNTSFDTQRRKILEDYLQDLIWDVKDPEEVGVLVEVMMRLQHSAVPPRPTNSRAAETPKVDRWSEKLPMNRAHDMQCTYDIFKQLPDHGPVWVGAVKGTEQVWKALISLKSNSGDNYFARDASEGRILEMFIN